MARKITKPVRKPTRAKTVKVPEIPDTQEDLLPKIGQVLDQVDAVMATRKSNVVLFNGYYDETVDKQNKAIQDLVSRLDRVLNPEKAKPAPTRYSYNRPPTPEPNTLVLLRDQFGATPGTVPTWARPGTFLLWIGYIPCRCVWGGFADPTADVVAATTTEKWIVPSGSLNTAVKINRSYKSPADVFRAYLTQLTEERDIEFSRGKERDRGPKFQLHDLHELGIEAVEQTLAKPDSAWLVEALKRGRTPDYIPLPPHLASVQMSWTG